MDPPAYRAPKVKDNDSQSFTPGTFVIQGPVPFKAGKKYSFSFSARGNRVKSAKISVYARFAGGGKVVAQTVQTKRGSVTSTGVEGREAVDLGLNEVFTVTDKWKKITTKDAVYTSKIPEALMNTDAIRGGIVISVTLEPSAGDFSIDDFQVIEK
jgi:hypothetical protein